MRDRVKIRGSVRGYRNNTWLMLFKVNARAATEIQTGRADVNPRRARQEVIYRVLPSYK